MKRFSTIRCASCVGWMIAVVLGMLSAACPSWSEDGSRMGYREGKEIVFRPRGAGVRTDALDPALRKWYVTQELFPEYQWRHWSTTNYAKQHYKPYYLGYYGGFSRDFDYFYDSFGNYIGYARLIYEWRQSQPRIFGSAIRGGTFMGDLEIASDKKGSYRYALSIGRRIYTVLTPLTFSKPAFDGAKLDFLSDPCDATLLFSRITFPFGGYWGSPLERTYVNNLVGGRAVVKLTEGVKVGGTYVNAHQVNTSSQPFSGNPFVGELTGPQNRDLRWITIRLSDDSPEDGVGGAAFFFQEVQITRTDGAVIRGDDVGLDPVVDGGIERIGFLAADGNEWIKLSYDFMVPTYTGPRPYEIRRVRFTLGLASDYRVEIASDLQTDRNNRPVFLIVARAPGNVRDHSNRRLVSFDYGLSTADEVIGVSVEVEDVGGFSVLGELAVSRQYRQWPNKAEKRHHTFTHGGTAGYVNLAYRRYPYLFFGEAFDIGYAYRTASLMADGAGRVDYEDLVGTQYEFVDDNDDLDRYPDWRRPPTGEPDPAVFPGYDENGDFLSDFNQNDNIFRRNQIPDYVEPFLRYGSDRPEYLAGMDMNHNTGVDRFENDRLPDYPYKSDHRGCNVYVSAYLAPDVRVAIGQLRERLVSSGKRAISSYLLFTLDRSPHRLGRIRVFEMVEKVRDHIPDDFLRWEQPSGGEGISREIEDPLAYQDTYANTLFLEWMYRGLIHKMKWAIVHQREPQERLRARGARTHSGFLGIIDKAEYLHNIGSLLLQLRWKSEFLREIPYLRDGERRNQLVETFSCFLRTGYSEWHKAKVFRKMTLETGVEVTAFNQFREPTPPGQYDDHIGTVWLTQWSLSSDFLGYRLITQIGFRLDRRRFEDTPPRMMGTGFCTVIAGIQE